MLYQGLRERGAVPGAGCGDPRLCECVHSVERRDLPGVPQGQRGGALIPEGQQEGRTLPDTTGMFNGQGWTLRESDVPLPLM